MWVQTLFKAAQKLSYIVQVEWNSSNPDTPDQAESVLISGVTMCTNMAFGAAKVVLFIEVSSNQGVLIRGVPLCTYKPAYPAGTYRQ